MYFFYVLMNLHVQYACDVKLGRLAWKDKTTVSHSFLHKSVRTDVATMERIKVTEMPIY